MSDIFSALGTATVHPKQDGLTLFCDFDGPIADVSERYYATYRLCLEALRAATGSDVIKALSQSQFWTFKQNRVPDRQIAYWSGLNSSETDRFLEQVDQQVNHPALLAYDCPQPMVREALALLRRYQVRVVLVTLRESQQVEQFLQAHQLNLDIADIFGRRQQQDTYGNRAEHKVDLLRQAIAHQQRHGYDLSLSCMIGDTEADIIAGQSAKIPTIALTCGIRSRSYLRGFRPTALCLDLWTAVRQLLSPQSVATLSLS